MSDIIKCFLCGSTSQKAVQGSSREIGINCDICGLVKTDLSFFNASVSIQTGLLKLYDKNNKPYSEDENEKAKICLRYFFKTQMDKDMILTNQNIEEIISKVPYPSSLLYKIELVLDYIAKKNFYLFNPIIFDTKTTYPIFFCKYYLFL